MKTVDLDFVQRLKLTALLSTQEGTLGKTAPFMRVLELVRFTDEESSYITTTQVDETHVTFTPPNAEFGKMTAQLETADAAAVAELIVNWPHFTTADHQWAQPILKALKQ